MGAAQARGARLYQRPERGPPVYMSAVPDSHARKLGLMKQVGATAIVLVNAAGADPEGLIRFYGDRVLPQLRV